MTGIEIAGTVEYLECDINLWCDTQQQSHLDTEVDRDLGVGQFSPVGLGGGGVALQRGRGWTCWLSSSSVGGRGQW